MRRTGTKPVVLATLLTLAMTGLAPRAIRPAFAATPGGVFLTGHDPDFHAGVSQGARNIIRKAIEYVTNGKASTKVLLVTSRQNPGAGYIDPRSGMQVTGYTFTMADHGSGTSGVLDLHTVDFANYDVIVVASDFGGWLRQAELDILNSRSGDIIRYINGGGGVVAFAESGGGGQTLTTNHRFGYLPFVVSEVPLDQAEAGFTVTPEGAALGLTNGDVNGNYSHNVFSEAGGLNVIDNDGQGRAMTLAARGLYVAPGGVPTLSVNDVTVTEPLLGDTIAGFTVTLSLASPDPVTVNYATSNGTATAPEDYNAASGTLTFDPGQTTKLIPVTVHGDLSVEGDETFTVTLSGAVNANIKDAEGTGTIKDTVRLTPETPVNHDPVCTGVAASPASLSPADRQFVPVTLSGATDPDGDTLTYRITAVIQDEFVDGIDPGDVSPDARTSDTPATVDLRAERANAGDGRVYTISFTVRDGKGGACTGTATVGVPRDGSRTDSGLQIDSFVAVHALGPIVLGEQLEQLPRTGPPALTLVLLGVGSAVVAFGITLLALTRRRRFES